MNYQTIIRTVVYLITLVNTLLTMAGHNPLPFSESEVYIYASIVITIIVFVYGVWKNYSITPEAKTADKIMFSLKAGFLQAEDVMGLIENSNELTNGKEEDENE